MKKLISIALAIMLIMSLATMAFADEPTGSITINNTVKTHTYTIYKMLDLVVDDPSDPTAFIYTVNEDWEDFFMSGTGALEYVDIDATTKAVTWKAAADDAVYAAFAKLALQFAQTNVIPAVESATAANTGSMIFDELALGYYLVDSTMGTLVRLNTNTPNAEFSDKNSAPEVDKTVQEGDSWKDSNSAQIGDTVNFRVQITVKEGAENYVLHDKMSAGLTYTAGSIVVKIGDEVVDADNYTVPDSTTDDCTFEVEFHDDYLATLPVGTKIDVYYSAVLNEDAIIEGSDGEDKNLNEVILDFGDKSNTSTDNLPGDSTETKTYKVDLVKTDSGKNLLEGAKFKLWDDSEPRKVVKVVQIDEDNYRVAVDGEDGAMEEFEVYDGDVTISGLDAATYYLEETVAPDGYNKLPSSQAFTVNDANMLAEYVDGAYDKGGVQVKNQAGSQLPETGAMGTAMFVSFGTLVVLGTGVLLITKKRMSMIED